MEGEKESILLLVKEEQIEGAQTLRNKSEEEFFKDVDPYLIRVDVKQRKRGGRKFKVE